MDFGADQNDAPGRLHKVDAEDVVAFFADRSADLYAGTVFAGTRAGRFTFAIADVANESDAVPLDPARLFLVDTDTDQAMPFDGNYPPQQSLSGSLKEG
jgi:hypothetical protein